MSPKPVPKREAMGLYAFRLPDALIADVDRFAKKLEAERPGIGVIGTWQHTRWSREV